MNEENDPASQATKSGFKSSEFTGAVALVAAILKEQPPLYITVTLGAVAGLYIISRTIDKFLVKWGAIQLSKQPNPKP